MLPNMVGAVIYVRVSTKEQTENLSLPTQLKAYEEYCERQGFHVLARFREEGESAKTADRTELQKLLQFCRKNNGTVQFVVVFNLTRFAREKYDHFALRAHLKSLGISLRSATESIDDTSTGKLMEGVLAAFAQFDNDVRSERTPGGMKAALELGRWTFLAPLGYLNAPRSTGRSLVPDPERVSLVRRAFQDFATGRFTKHEVRKNLNALGLTTRRGKPVPSQTFDAMLRNRVYIGGIDVPEFNVSTRGDFEPLITERIFFRVQAIDGRYEVIAPRQRNDPDFPLRGYVRCESCGKTLTASWSKGRSDYYDVLPLAEGLSCGQHRQVEAGRPVRRRAGAPAAHARVHAARQRPRARCLARDAKRRTAADCGDRGQAEDHSRTARPFGRGIPLRTHHRHRYVRPPPRQLREELTIAQMDRHSCELEEMDVEGVLAFAERVLPSASNLWVQSSLRSSACSRCSFRTGFALTGRSLLEPVQHSRFSTT
jgi:DNA invertase Pin-like site-specific DNA recombinase